MHLKYLKFMQKWLTTYKGKAIGIGDTPAEAIMQGLLVITYK